MRTTNFVFGPWSKSAWKWPKSDSHVGHTVTCHVLGKMCQRPMRVLDVSSMHGHHTPTSLLLSPAPLCTQRRALERPPHPPPLPHSIFLAWIFLFCLWQHARRAPPWQASPARASATASRSRPRLGPGVTTAGRGQAADWLPAVTSRPPAQSRSRPCSSVSSVP